MSYGTPINLRGMTTDPAPVPGYPWRVFLAALGVLALGFMVLGMNWAVIPDPVPVHFTGSGEPDRWEPKTWWSVTFLLWVGFGLLVLLGGLAALGPVAAHPMPVDPAQGGVPLPFSRSLAHRLQYLLGHLGRGLAVLGLILCSGLVYAAVASMLPRWSGHLTASIVALLIGALVGTLALVVLVVRAAGRARVLFPPDEDERTRLGARDDPSLYRVGVLYTNPADPMALVQSRWDPDNVDFNYAHLPGRVFTVGLVAVLVGGFALLVFAVS